jgi:hypothetical protein
VPLCGSVDSVGIVTKFVVCRCKRIPIGRVHCVHRHRIGSHALNPTHWHVPANPLSRRQNDGSVSPWIRREIQKTRGFESSEARDTVSNFDLVGGNTRCPVAAAATANDEGQVHYDGNDPSKRPRSFVDTRFPSCFTERGVFASRALPFSYLRPRYRKRNSYSLHARTVKHRRE